MIGPLREPAREGSGGSATPGVETWPGLLAALVLYVIAFAGIYMVFANYGLVFFTGKNVYLLGLDSVGDALETLALAGMAALALGARGAPGPPGADAGGAALEPVEEAWWRP